MFINIYTIFLYNATYLFDFLSPIYTFFYPFILFSKKYILINLQLIFWFKVLPKKNRAIHIRFRFHFMKYDCIYFAMSVGRVKIYHIYYIMTHIYNRKRSVAERARQRTQKFEPYNSLCGI